jgi:colanic acid/amylovoran biosynthesis glycosyltransferase
VLIVYILDEFPSDSEYFILNEIIELTKRGLTIQILAMRKKKGTKSNGFGLINLKVLYDKGFFSPVKLAAHFYLLFSAGIKYFKVIKKVAKGKGSSLASLVKGLTKFSTGVYFLFLSRKLPVNHIHAHFSSVPTDIAMIMSGLSGIRFSCSAHSRDIYTADKEALVRKMDQAQFFITCTMYNKMFLESLSQGVAGCKIFHVYHGINLALWPMAKLDHKVLDKAKVHLLTVSRLVEKKGLIYLLEAVKMLRDRGLRIECSIIGDGPLRGQIEKYRDLNGLHRNIHLHGMLPQSAIKSFYLSADIFVLPSIVAADGDRDGLPNVLVEALAVGIPVIATSISAIPELVIHESTGILVPDRSAADIRDAILRLLRDKELCKQMAENGRRKVEEEFSIHSSTNRLVGIFTSNGQCV